MNKKKFVVIGGIVIGVLVVLVLVFRYFPMTDKGKNITFSNIPFEEDFHLSKGFLQTGAIEYYFNISLTTELVVDVWSDEPINFKLYNYESGNIETESKWDRVVLESVVVKSGIWVVNIVPSNSHTNGLIKVTTRTPFPTHMYVQMSATREWYGVMGMSQNITISYEDKLEETISVLISIKIAQHYVEHDIEVWNCTKSGTDRNKFTVIWTEADTYDYYFVEIIVNHQVFGELRYSKCV